MAKRADALDTFDVLGIPISAVTLDVAFRALVTWGGDDVGRVVTAPDVSNIVRSWDDPKLSAIHRQAAMVCPDGMPLVWLGRQLARKSVERTCGPDLIDYVVGHGDRNVTHYFYGGKEGVAGLLKKRFETSYPNARIVGADTPPFRDLSDDEINQKLDDFRVAGATVIWIGISTPKQERLAQRFAERSSATFVAVGAAFDFHAGVVKRAPRWMQNNGLEWIYRFASEPTRLWKRYLIMAPRFIGLLALYALRRRHL